MTFFKKQKKSFLDIAESDIDSKFQGCSVKSGAWRAFPEQKRPQNAKNGPFRPQKGSKRKNKKSFFFLPRMGPKSKISS